MRIRGIVEHSDRISKVRVFELREKLTADRIYYVRTDGSNSNNGLTNTATGAWLTLNKAWKYICTNLDLNGHTVTINIADGTYNAGVAHFGDTAGVDSNYETLYQPVGPGIVKFNGNASDKTAVVIQGSENSDWCGFAFAGPSSAVTVQNLTVDGLNTYSPFYIQDGARVTLNNVKIQGGAANLWAVQSTSSARTNVVATTIAGANWAGMARVQDATLLLGFYSTLTITDTPVWGTAGVQVTYNGLVNSVNATINGTATGKRYDVTVGSTIVTTNGSASFYPGDVAGTDATGGTYA